MHMCEYSHSNSPCAALAKHSASVGRALDWGSKDRYFKSRHWSSHCVVYLSKTLNPLLNNGSTQELEDLF